MTSQRICSSVHVAINSINSEWIDRNREKMTFEKENVPMITKDELTRKLKSMQDGTEWSRT